MGTYRVSWTLVGTVGRYLFGDVVEDVGLHGQLHEDGADDPAELALTHIENALDELCLCAAQLAAVSAASRVGDFCFCFCFCVPRSVPMRRGPWP
jgi:hypothetical protein